MPRHSYSKTSSENLGAIYWLLIAAIIICCLLMVSQRGEARLRQTLQSTSDDAVSPLIGLISKPMRGLENFLFSVEDRQRAFEENKVLRQELQSLREAQSSMALLEAKISDYEKILKVEHGTDQRVSKIATRAISDIDGPFVRAILLNSGQKSGLSKGDAVMSPEGMIGHVILAGRSSSRVLRVDDISSRIPVMSGRTQAVAILAGDNTDFPKLTFIGRGMDWNIGDKVLTSGDEGQLPRGLHIGVISKKEGNEFRVDVTGLKSPLNTVYVPKFEEIQTPVQESEDNLLAVPGNINLQPSDSQNSVPEALNNE